MKLVTRQDRIYQAEHEIFLLKKDLGCSRFVYNQCLEYAEDRYKEGLPYPGYKEDNDFASLIVRLKHNPDYKLSQKSRGKKKKQENYKDA